VVPNAESTIVSQNALMTERAKSQIGHILHHRFSENRIQEHAAAGHDGVATSTELWQLHAE
jgi:hypothetical protein